MKIRILASNNKHKIKEFKQIFKEDEILSLNDIGYYEEIAETGTTFLENALIKAKTIHEYLKKTNKAATVIADDSGLCVNSLNGEPGVYSARYSGDHNDAQNREKLLNELKDKSDRSAYFVCLIVEYLEDGSYVFVEGKTYGKILEEEKGDTSFGYDCLFYSTELKKSFGEATNEEKNSVSHRGRAIVSLIEKEKEMGINQ